MTTNAIGRLRTTEHGNCGLPIVTERFGSMFGEWPRKRGHKSMPTIPEKRTAWDKVKDSWSGLRVAHEATMLQDARAVLASNRSRDRLHESRLNAFKAGKPMPETEDDVGDIHIGDVNQISSGGKTNGVGKLIGAALLGAGLPAAGWLAASALSNKPDAPQVVDTDTDTQYQLTIPGEPK